MSQRIKVQHHTGDLIGSVDLPNSKSIVNRVLILYHLYFSPSIPEWLSSTSRDSLVMRRNLKIIEARTRKNNISPSEINAEDAGTCFRFLMALLTITPGNWVLRGTERLLSRPHKPLIDVLKKINPEIRVMKDGIEIQGIDPSLSSVQNLSVDGSKSSQFASALMMILPKLGDGRVQLNIEGDIVSSSYLELTLDLMQKVGFNLDVANDLTRTSFLQQNLSYQITEDLIEKDWSSAPYFITMGLLASKANIFFPGLKLSKSQADQSILELVDLFGGEVKFEPSGMRFLCTSSLKRHEEIERNYIDCPDLALTEVVFLHILKIKHTLNGIQHLKYKESNRLENILLALKNYKLNPNKALTTDLDHRMAMSLSLLGVQASVFIDEPLVVQKSFPNFWQEMQHLGFELTLVNGD